MMVCAESNTTPTGQRGTILAVTLVFLLLLAMVATSALQTSGLQLRMALHYGAYERALRLADAVAVAMVQQKESFDVLTTVGYTRCLTGDSATHCDSHDLAWPAAAPAAGRAVVRVAVARRFPMVLEHPTTGIAHTPFEVVVSVSGEEDATLGSVEVAYGVAVTEPASPPWYIYWREPAGDLL